MSVVCSHSGFLDAEDEPEDEDEDAVAEDVAEEADGGGGGGSNPCTNIGLLYVDLPVGAIWK